MTAKHVLGISQSIILIALYFGLLIATLFLIVCFQRVVRLQQDFDSATIDAVGHLFVWPTIIWIGLRWSGMSFSEVFPVKRFSMKIVPSLLMATFGSLVLLYEVSGLIPMPEALRKFDCSAGSGKFSLFFAYVLIAPITEECFFRGLLLRCYLCKYSAARAVWTSAIVFALFHLNPWQAIIALPLGLGFAWLTLRTGSLVPAILCHMVANLSAQYLINSLVMMFGWNGEEIKPFIYFPPAVIALCVFFFPLYICFAYGLKGRLGKCYVLRT